MPGGCAQVRKRGRERDRPPTLRVFASSSSAPPANQRRCRPKCCTAGGVSHRPQNRPDADGTSITRRGDPPPPAVTQPRHRRPPPPSPAAGRCWTLEQHEAPEEAPDSRRRQPPRHFTCAATKCCHPLTIRRCWHDESVHPRISDQPRQSKHRAGYESARYERASTRHPPARCMP